MALEQQLRVPGPTPLPERVVRSQSRPMVNHRGPEAAVIVHEIVAGLRWALQTENDVLILPASGTGGLEAAVVNLLSRGERALFCIVGNFGSRWASIAEAYGVDVVRLEVPWGEPLDPEDIERTLARDSAIRTVFVTHNETSTGVVNDMPAIAAAVKGRGALLAVDSVSGAGCMPLPVDELQLDLVVTGSQKGWMAPPGLAMLSVSDGAWEATRRADLPRFYWDLARQKSFVDRGTTYTTPPLSVMYALQEGLAMMREEGLENVHRRHHTVAEMIRGGLTAMGLRLFAAAGHRSDTVTAVHSPVDDPDALKALLGELRTRHGLVLAGGQGQLTGRIFRVGHLGFIEEKDACGILALIEIAMLERGMLSRGGLAVPAAQAALRAALAAPAEAAPAVSSAR